MDFNDSNCVVILGSTAVGKTSVGVKVANELNGEIISADSRQTYKYLDIGSGKDLNEYEISGNKIKYHLIDIVELPEEYNVYKYQKDFYKAFDSILLNNKFPVIVGGTGMYLDCIIRNYDLVDVPENKELHHELESLSIEDLQKKLLKMKSNLHNKTDLLDKDRLIKSIEVCIATEKNNNIDKHIEVKPAIFGISLPRPELWNNIKKRLIERLDSGMIEEVKNIHDKGISFERLETLGLEYRYCSLYLQNKIATKEELIEKLFIAIRQFAKRQETWFRGMEKKGVKINWIPVTNKDEMAKYIVDKIKHP